MTGFATAATAHGEDCGCTRCAGVQPGNGLAERHGCYSGLRLQPRAKTLRAEVEALVPFGTTADAPMIDLLALTLAQAERAGLALAVEQAQSAAATTIGDPPSPRLDRLAQDARGWVNTATKLLDALGLSPTSRARLAGDLAGAERTLTARALRARYGADEDRAA